MFKIIFKVDNLLKIHASDYQVERHDGRIQSAIGCKTEGFKGHLVKRKWY